VTYKYRYFSSAAGSKEYVFYIPVPTPLTHPMATFLFAACQNLIYNPLDTSHIQPMQSSQHYPTINPDQKEWIYRTKLKRWKYNIVHSQTRFIKSLTYTKMCQFISLVGKGSLHFSKCHVRCNSPGNN